VATAPTWRHRLRRIALGVAFVVCMSGNEGLKILAGFDGPATEDQKIYALGVVGLSAALAWAAVPTDTADRQASTDSQGRPTRAVVKKNASNLLYGR
jgi:hypothetical protein